MPVSLRIALGAVWFQIVVSGLYGVVVCLRILEAHRHGRLLANPVLAYFTGYGSLVSAAVLAVGACLVMLGYESGRVVVTAVELLAVLSGVMSLVSGEIEGIVSIVIALGVLGELVRESTRGWFEAKQDQREFAGLDDKRR